MALVNFGTQTTGSSSVQMPPANNKAVCKFQNNTGHDVPVARFYAKWGVANATTKIKAVIYSDAAGSPAALLATSNERIGVTGTAWDVFTFPSPATVAAGAYVWIGVIADIMTTGAVCTTAAAGTLKYNSDTYSDGPTATFGTPSNASFQYPMFVEGDDGQLRFGRASVDSGSGNYQIDREHGDSFTLGGAASVSVASISTYVQTTSATVKSKAALFTDDAGAPGTKIAQTQEVVGSTASTWLTLPFASPPTLAPGVYWLTFIADTDLVTPVIAVGGKLWVDGSDTEATAFSSPSSLTFNQAPNGIDIYASYSVIGGGSARPVCFVCM